MSNKENKSNKKEMIDEETKGLQAFSSLLQLQEEYPEDLPSDVEPQEKRKIKTENKKYLRKYVEPHMDDPTDDVSGKESLEGWIDKKPVKEETQALKSLSFLMNDKVPEKKDTEDKVEIDKSDSIVENNSNIKNAMDVLSGVSENFLKNLRKGNEEQDRKHKLRIERILEKQRNEVKEELDEFSQFRNEFEIFKKTMETKLTLREQVGFASNSLGSGAGSGEVRLLNLDDVDGTGIGNNSILKYNSTTKKFAVGSDTSGLSNVVEDTTPQLGGNLDTNSQNILIDDAHFIGDENGNEQIIFQTTSSAVNQFDVTNAATGNPPELSSTGDDTNIGLKITPKGSGAVIIDGLSYPTSDGTNGQFLKTDGSGTLSFATVSSSVAFDDVTAGDSALNITTTTGNITIDAQANDSDIILKGTDGTSDTTFLTIDGSAAGKATFNNEIVSGAVITSGAGLVIADDGTIGSASDTDAIAIDSSGVVTFSQKPVSNSGITIDNITIDGTEIDLSSGDLTLDVAGDIILDAGGEQVIFKDGSTNVGHADLSSDNLTLKSLVSDKDFIVKGNDGGTEITALTLDMSAAGAATFNNNVTAFSDERLKSEIKTIEDGLTKVEQLRGVTYVRDDIKDSGQQLGVIAQEIEKVLPQVVLTANDDMQTKSVDYGRLTGVLIEAVKELSARVKELESK